jgi:hypothetical protein
MMVTVTWTTHSRRRPLTRARYCSFVMMHRLALSLGLAAAPAACSVLLDFEECEVDEQCEEGSQCMAG